MEIIKRMLRPNILVVQEEELDQVDWSKIANGCIYLDIWGKIHYELNYLGFYNFFHNTNWIHLLFQHEKLYEALPFRLLKACKTKPFEDLIGVRQFTYFQPWRIIVPSSVGILPWEFIKKRGDEKRNSSVGDVRKTAFRVLFGKLDDVARRLRAKSGFFPTAVIADEKMREYGCIPKPLKGLRKFFFQWILNFPFRNQRIYIKRYDNSGGDSGK